MINNTILSPNFKLERNYILLSNKYLKETINHIIYRSNEMKSK